MMRMSQLLNTAVAALLALLIAGAAQAQDIDTLHDQLAQPDNAGWRRVERQIMTEWSKSGSSSMDLLLQRGRDAIRSAEFPTAIEHFTALIDHAPDFAEGYHGRATAYFHAGLYGPAMEDLARVLALNPRHFRAISGLATILAETDRKAQALAAYRAALAIHPHLEDIKDAVKRLETELEGQSI
jgi:tetratricopeptide (TPR) repeat protein